MSEIEREKRERKLVALMLNDLSGDMQAGEVSAMRREIGELPDEELHRTLAGRLNLDDGATDEDLAAALAFVGEPEILSDEEGSGDSNDLGTTPDMSHADDAEGSR